MLTSLSPAARIARFLSSAFLLVLLCSPLPALAQRGAITAHRNLAQLTDGAANIIDGMVLSARVETHPTLSNLQTVLVTMRVARALKGSVSGRFQFRQLIWDIRDRAEFAGYRRGEHLLLFMNQPSAYGLSSPVGLEQGRFRIMRNGAGEMTAINGQMNAALLTGVRERIGTAQMPARVTALLQSHRQGAISLDDLAQLVGQLERAK